MPNLPHSRAAERVRARIASFDDAYGRVPHRAEQRGVRTHGDDASSALVAHVREDRLHAPERALGPGVQQHVHVVLGDLGERRDRTEGLRVGDETVDASELGDGALDQREGAVAVGHVERGREVGRADLFELGRGLVERLRLAGGDHERRAAAARGGARCRVRRPSTRR